MIVGASEGGHVRGEPLDAGRTTVIGTANESLLEALAAIVGVRHAFTDPELTAPYERDWTGRYGARASIVVRPANTTEVAAVVRTAVEHGVAIVPQGGNTGLVGGGVPRCGEVLISLTRLKE